MRELNSELLLKIYTIEPGESGEQQEEATRQLYEDLLETNASRVQPVRDQTAPEGTRAADAVSLGPLLVTFMGAGGVLTTLISTIKDWLVRDKRRSITLFGARMVRRR